MKTIGSRLRKLGCPIALMLFFTAAAAEAAVITNVTVTIGGVTFTSASVGWTFPYTLLPGQDLVLTQSFNGPPNTTTSFNFDTGSVLGPGNIPQISITADGVTTVFSDTGQVLNVRGSSTMSPSDNRAQLYSGALAGPDGLAYQVFVGYADNTHTGPCGVWATSIGLNGSATCLPQIFNGLYGSGIATFFDGAGGLLPPPLVNTLPNHCTTGADCYQAGVIRILAVNPQQPIPEPATMALVLTGGALAAVRRYRRSTNRN